MGVLIFDETKVQSKIVWNAINSTIRGYAMSPEELRLLHMMCHDKQKTTHILQFLCRDLTSKFDVIGP